MKKKKEYQNIEYLSDLCYTIKDGKVGRNIDFSKCYDQKSEQPLSNDVYDFKNVYGQELPEIPHLPKWVIPTAGGVGGPIAILIATVLIARWRRKHK